MHSIKAKNCRVGFTDLYEHLVVWDQWGYTSKDPPNAVKHLRSSGLSRLYSFLNSFSVPYFNFHPSVKTPIMTVSQMKPLPHLCHFERMETSNFVLILCFQQSLIFVLQDPNWPEESLLIDEAGYTAVALTFLPGVTVWPTICHVVLPVTASTGSDFYSVALLWTTSHSLTLSTAVSLLHTPRCNLS